MPTIIRSSSIIKAAGNPSGPDLDGKPKVIEELIGRVNSKTEDISIAKMKSPAGWAEPGQIPEFDEYTIVLKGTLRVESKGETIDVKQGEAIIAHKGEWVRYSSPLPEGAEYIAICLPAFSPEIVHRNKD